MIPKRCYFIENYSFDTECFLTFFEKQFIKHEFLKHYDKMGIKPYKIKYTYYIAHLRISISFGDLEVIDFYIQKFDIGETEAIKIEIHDLIDQVVSLSIINFNSMRMNDAINKKAFDAYAAEQKKQEEQYRKTMDKVKSMFGQNK